MHCQRIKTVTIESEIAEIRCLRRPVGIVVFGVDSEFKTQILDQLIAGLHPAANGSYAGSSDEKMKMILRGAQDNTILHLSSEESADRDTRLKAIQRLFDAGAETVVGIYIKPKFPRKIPMHDLSAEAKQRRMTLERCVAALKRNPPTDEGLDHLCIFDEAKEG